MKYIISESQYKLLIFEQIPETRYMSPEEKEAFMKGGLGRPLTHDETFYLSLIASFLGPIGLGLAALLQTNDAIMHFNEGNTKEGGLSLIFTALPLLGFTSKIAGIAGKTPKFLKSLADKVIKNKGKNLTQEEKVIVQSIGKNAKAIEEGLNSKVKPLANTLSKLTIFSPELSAKLKRIASVGFNFVTPILFYLGVESAYDMAYDKVTGKNNQPPNNVKPPSGKNSY